MFVSIEKKILNTMYVAGRPLDTYQIAKKVGISWATAKNHLEELHRKGYVTSGLRGIRKYWWLKEE